MERAAIRKRSKCATTPLLTSCRGERDGEREIKRERSAYGNSRGIDRRREGEREKEEEERKGERGGGEEEKEKEERSGVGRVREREESRDGKRCFGSLDLGESQDSRMSNKLQASLSPSRVIQTAFSRSSPFTQKDK